MQYGNTLFINGKIHVLFRKLQNNISAGVEIANFKLEIDGWRERWSVINNPKPTTLSETLQIQIQIFIRVSIHVYSYCHSCQ